MKTFLQHVITALSAILLSWVLSYIVGPQAYIKHRLQAQESRLQGIGYSLDWAWESLDTANLRTAKEE